MNIPPSTIRGFRRKNNIFYSTLKIKDPPDVFIKKYEELQSQNKMAKFYNVNHHTIQQFCEKIGFDDSIYKKKKIPKEKVEYILSQYNIKSSKELADELKINISTITGIWTRNNLKNKEKRVYHLKNKDYFEKIDSQDKAYFLGFIAADGCIYDYKNDNRQDILRIQIQKDDVKILNKLKEVLDTNKPIIYCSSNKYVALEISSNKIVEDIKNVGLDYRKTYKNTIAQIPSKFVNAFIRGYFDGDGSISLKDNNPSISIVGYKSNMEKIMNMLRENNILTSIFIDKRLKYNLNEFGDKFTSLLITNKTMAYCFLKFIYKDSDDFFLDRKKKKADMFIEHINESKNIRDMQTKIYYEYAVQRVG